LREARYDLTEYLSLDRPWCNADVALPLSTIRGRPGSRPVSTIKFAQSKFRGR
jgi:hypothetical protein